MKNITTTTYGANVNKNNSWWRATLTAEKLNPPKKIEYKGHDNAELQAIHANANLSREEKIALAKKILNGKTEKPITKKNDTKSKVCVIANKLIKEGLNRSAAFVKAWGIVKTATLQVKVAGVSFGNRQEALKRLKQYDAENIKIQLEREATNEYDADAIKVITTVKGKGSYTIGYIPKTLSKLISPLIDYGKAVNATFKEVVGKYQSYHNYGLEVCVNI